MGVCVIVFWVWNISDSVRFVFFVPFQCASAAVFGLPYGCRGVSRAPRFQLCVRCAGPCRARGGCRAAVSVAGALLALGVV